MLLLEFVTLASLTVVVVVAKVVKINVTIKGLSLALAKTFSSVYYYDVGL